MQIPSNSNIALLFHAVDQSPESEAVEFFIMTGIIHYCEEVMAMDLTQLKPESAEWNIAVNMQNIATDLMNRIQKKHSPTLKESNNGTNQKQNPEQS